MNKERESRLAKKKKKRSKARSKGFRKVPNLMIEEADSTHRRRRYRIQLKKTFLKKSLFVQTNFRFEIKTFLSFYFILLLFFKRDIFQHLCVGH